MKTLKICDVKTVYEARTLGRLKIPLLGFHYVSENDKARSEVIKLCIGELRRYYPTSHSVLVVKEQDVSEVIRIAKEFEPDYIQLHFEEGGEMIPLLKSVFKDHLKIIQVLSSWESLQMISSQADLYILDKSFRGGTGEEQEFQELMKKIAIVPKKLTLLAGGISISNVDKYEELNLLGFDVQSGVKNETKGVSYTKVTELSNKLGYFINSYTRAVGYSSYDLQLGESSLFVNAINAGVDFLHLDITDGFIGSKSNIELVIAHIRKIREISEHVPIELHLFTKSSDSARSMLDALSYKSINNSKAFIHVNRDNIAKFAPSDIINKGLYTALDVRDVLEDSFDLDPYIGTEILLSLPSKDEKARNIDLLRALKIIETMYSEVKGVTIERGVDCVTLQKIEQNQKLNVVSSSYLAKNMHDRYIILKNLLYEN